MIKIHPKEEQMSELLKKAIDENHFDFDGFIKKISQEHPELIATDIGKAYLIRALNASAQKAWKKNNRTNECTGFYQAVMQTELESRVPYIEEGFATEFCTTKGRQYKGPAVSVDYYVKGVFDPSYEHAMERRALRLDTEKKRFSAKMDHDAEVALDKALDRFEEKKNHRRKSPSRQKQERPEEEYDM